MSTGIGTDRYGCHSLAPLQLIGVVLMLVQNQQAIGRLRSESMFAGPPLYPSATSNIDKCHAHVGPALAIVAGDHACCHHLLCNPAGLCSKSPFSTATACSSPTCLPSKLAPALVDAEQLEACTAASVKLYPTQSQLMPQLREIDFTIEKLMWCRGWHDHHLWRHWAVCDHSSVVS